MIDKTSTGTLGVFLCMANWSLIEIIRFGFYAIKAGGDPNGFLADLFGHLRYNSFIFAYPLGILAESVAIYNAYQVLVALSYE
jgi:hypothetical protein